MFCNCQEEIAFGKVVKEGPKMLKLSLITTETSTKVKHYHTCVKTLVKLRNDLNYVCQEVR